MDEGLQSDEHWSLMPELRPYFLVASVIAIIVFVVAVVANVFSLDETTTPLLRSIPFRIVGVIVGTAGAASAFLLWIGMWSYWWQIDRRRNGMSVGRLLLLSLGNWVGATIYYFLVFRRISLRERPNS